MAELYLEREDCYLPWLPRLSAAPLSVSTTSLAAFEPRRGCSPKWHCIFSGSKDIGGLLQGEAGKVGRAAMGGERGHDNDGEDDQGDARLPGRLG